MLDKQTVYKRSIQKHLYFGEALSCAEISDLIKKSLPLTTRLINELVEEGLLEETGFALSTGGRRPQMYSLKADLQYVLAVAMDQLITRVVLLDMRNQPVAEVRNFDLSLPNNPLALQQLADILQEYLQHCGIEKERIVGIGIGMPGFVDVIKGLNHSFLKTSQGNITSFLEEATQIPVLIDNDSSLIALAELKLGKARNKQNCMVINLSWGIGLGIIAKGELFRGENGFAGEFSHIPMFNNDKLCACGKSGCLETEASLLVLAKKAIEGLKEGRATVLKNLNLDDIESTIRSILNAASNGDKFAIELISEIGYNIGRGIAILIHLLNPEQIILSGRGSVAGRLWLAPIQQAINEHCIPKLAENTSIVISELGYEAELVGAAALVMDHLEQIESAEKKLDKISI